LPLPSSRDVGIRGPGHIVSSTGDHNNNNGMGVLTRGRHIVRVQAYQQQDGCIDWEKACVLMGGGHAGRRGACVLTGGMRVDGGTSSSTAGHAYRRQGISIIASRMGVSIVG